MQVYKSALALALLAVCSGAFAGNSGTMMRKDGKAVPVTAIYVQPDHAAAYIVFSDNDKATKAVEHLANTSYSSVDGILSAEHIFRDLAVHGAHPLLLNIGGWISDSQPIFDLQMVDGGVVKRLQTDKAKVHIDHDDERHIEGSLKYADKGLELDLAFALDKGPRTFAGAGLPAEPPPPPPEPQNPRGQMMLATDLLRIKVGEYFAAHEHTWPSALTQVDLQGTQLPSKVASRTLGAGGVITTTFVTDYPRLGGKTITMTPHADADGSIGWKCSAPGVAEDDMPLACD